MSETWGALRSTETFPSDLLFPPPRTSLGRSSESSTLASQSEKGKVPPEPPWVRPPKLKLGLDLGTWQDSPLLGNTSSSPCDLSRGYEAGGTVSEMGHGWSYQTHPHTQTRTDSETKGKNRGCTDSAIILLACGGNACNSRHHPLDLKRVAA